MPVHKPHIPPATVTPIHACPGFPPPLVIHEGRRASENHGHGRVNESLRQIGVSGQISRGGANGDPLQWSVRNCDHVTGAHDFAVSDGPDIFGRLPTLLTHIHPAQAETRLVILASDSPPIIAIASPGVLAGQDRRSVESNETLHPVVRGAAPHPLTLRRRDRIGCQVVFRPPGPHISFQILDPGPADLPVQRCEVSWIHCEITHIEVQANPHLPEIAFAHGRIGRRPRPRQGRQEQGCQGRDDRGDDQQFHQSETTPETGRSPQVLEISCRVVLAHEGVLQDSRDPPDLRVHPIRIPGPKRTGVRQKTGAEHWLVRRPKPP